MLRLARLRLVPLPPCRRHCTTTTISTTSYMDLSRWLANAMRAHGSHDTIAQARKIHARMICMGLSSSTFLQNHLVNMYSGCGSLDEAYNVFQCICHPNVFSWNMMITGFCNGGRLCDARRLFDEMSDRDCVSWNAMMSGYVQMGECDEAMRVFVSMICNLGCRPNQFSMSCALKACGGIECGQLGLQLHGFGNKAGLVRDPHVEISLLDMYVKCGSMEFAAKHFEQMSEPDMLSWNRMILGYSKLGRVDQALKMFYEMPDRDVISWNTIISILSQHGYGIRALLMLIEMQNEGIEPDSLTYASVISACSSVFDLECGRHLHARILRCRTDVDVYVGTALVDMYAKCGCLVIARRVFDGLTNHNAASWTSMIAGCVQSGCVKEGLLLFNQMTKEGVASDQFTFATVLGACSSKDMDLGTQLHCHSIKLGLDSYIPVSNALLVMYAKCGSLQSSDCVFQSMTTRDIISWTSMVTVHSHAGDLPNAISYFKQMPERNLVTWNSMLAAYIQHGLREEGFKMYILMHREGKVKPDWVTFVTLLSACAYSGSLSLGSQIVAQIAKAGFDTDTSVANGMVTMYSKCGRIHEAQQVFNSIANKDLVSWNSMMSGYAQNGTGRKVIEVFESMILEGVNPDHISYVAALSGCSHSGLVSEGKFYFDSMTKDHNIYPNIEHFACMVDLLGRSGLLDQAKEMIDKMPVLPNAAVWGALLGACKIHGNTELAEYAVKNLCKFNPKNSGSYVLLANIYFDAGKSDDVAEVRKVMKERGIRKNPGCSWIEVNNATHVFTSDDMSHPQIDDILKSMSEIIHGIKAKEFENDRCL